jgi:small subunit ribosomal protein S20
MANHKSAEKRARQNVKRRARNRAHRSRLRNQIKKLRSAAEGGQADAARELLKPTLSMVDRSVQKGILHDRAAARTKSRLSRLLDRTVAQA